MKTKRKKQKEIDVRSVEIKSGVSRTYYGGGRLNKWFYIFVNMKVDDSFGVPFDGTEEDEKRVKNILAQAIRNYRLNTDMESKYTVRAHFVKKEIRVWRDAPFEAKESAYYQKKVSEIRISDLTIALELAKEKEELLETLKMANEMLISKYGNLFKQWPESIEIERVIKKNEP